MSPDDIVVIDGLTLTGPSGSVLVEKLSMSIPRAGSVGLVGESGSGKSLTALTIAQLLPHGIVASGSVRYEGRELLGLSDVSMRQIRGRGIGVVFQDPFSSLNPVFTVRSQMLDLMGRHRSGLGKRESIESAMSALRDVGLKDPHEMLSRYPHQLSGGQAQRVAIAMALVPEPELLIADEPTTALDVTVQEGILSLLEDLRRARKLSLLFISHDLAVVARLCSEMQIMQGGRVVERGPTRQIITAPRADYTRLLIESVARIPRLTEPSTVRVEECA